jgi:hypothetical protein
MKLSFDSATEAAAGSEQGLGGVPQRVSLTFEPVSVGCGMVVSADNFTGKN